MAGACFTHFLIYFKFRIKDQVTVKYTCKYALILITPEFISAWDSAAALMKTETLSTFKILSFQIFELGSSLYSICKWITLIDVRISTTMSCLVTQAEPAETSTAWTTCDMIASTILDHWWTALWTLLGVSCDPNWWSIFSVDLFHPFLVFYFDQAP